MLRISANEYMKRISFRGLKHGYVLEPEYIDGVLTSVIPLENFSLSTADEIVHNGLEVYKCFKYEDDIYVSKMKALKEPTENTYKDLLDRVKYLEGLLADVSSLMITDTKVEKSGYANINKIYSKLEDYLESDKMNWDFLFLSDKVAVEPLSKEICIIESRASTNHLNLVLKNSNDTFVPLHRFSRNAVVELLLSDISLFRGIKSEEIIPATVVEKLDYFLGVTVDMECKLYKVAPFISSLLSFLNYAKDNKEEHYRRANQDEESLSIAKALAYHLSNS